MKEICLKLSAIAALAALMSVHSAHAVVFSVDGLADGISDAKYVPFSSVFVPSIASTAAASWDTSLGDASIAVIPGSYSATSNFISDYSLLSAGGASSTPAIRWTRISTICRRRN